MNKAILFDIDGTLLDTRKFVFGAVKYALAQSGYPYPSEKDLKKVMGKPLVEFYRGLLADIEPDKLSQLHRQFQEKNFHLIKAFPKTIKTIQILKESGFLLAAVSNRLRGSLVLSLKLTGIFDYFDTIVSADDVINPKPHQEHLFVALDSIQVQPENAYMVGDTDHDILAGQNAKVKTVGVTYGWFGSGIKKYKPDYLIDDIEELLRILKCAKI